MVWKKNRITIIQDYVRTMEPVELNKFAVSTAWHR